MAFWNISANTAASLINGLPSGVDNNEGTIRQAGNVSATSNFSDLNLRTGKSRYITVVSGVNGVTGAIAGAAFNTSDRVGVMRRVTTDLAGVSNQTLYKGSNSANRDFAINQMATNYEYLYKTAVRTGQWNEFSGVFETAVGVTGLGIWSQATDADVATTAKTDAVDHAANPTAAIPGELVYRDGSPLPIQDDYAAKNSF